MYQMLNIYLLCSGLETAIPVGHTKDHTKHLGIQTKTIRPPTTTYLHLHIYFIVYVLHINN